MFPGKQREERRRRRCVNGAGVRVRACVLVSAAWPAGARLCIHTDARLSLAFPPKLQY